MTVGLLYDVFPFDNRLVRLTLTGAELRLVFADEIRRKQRGALGISGVLVKAGCAAGGLEVELFHATGRPIGADERVVVVAMDSLVSGLMFATVPPPAGFSVPADAPTSEKSLKTGCESAAVSSTPSSSSTQITVAGSCQNMVQVECAGL